MRNVTSLHHLLDDVTSLARLQAGREQRRIEPIDVTPIVQQLCEGIRPLAQQHRLFLRCDGPPGFAAEGDVVKIRRIAQNLILNAVKFTREGGITVSWGDSATRRSEALDAVRPGYRARDSLRRGKAALERVGRKARTARSRDPAPRTRARASASPSSSGCATCWMRPSSSIGLRAVGTTFKILFPRQYS